MKEKINYYWYRALRIFSYVIIGVSIISIYNFAIAENYNSAASSLFGIAIGYILLLHLINRETQLEILDSFAAIIESLTAQVENQVENQIVTKTITDPEQIQKFITRLGLDKEFAEVPSLSLLQTDLLKAIENEDYEEAEKIKKQIEQFKKENPPKED